ncbi:hypothetical protein HQ590_06300 [bacterium]|nr:hypothetical protein [bacterium]
MWTTQSWYNEAFAAARANAPRVKATADYLLRIYEESLPGQSRDQIGRRLADYNQKRLQAVPDLAQYPELRGMPEFVAAGWRGAREGAGLDDILAAVWNGGLDYLHREVSGKVGRQPAHCTCVYFGRSDHGPLLGTNLDTNPDEPYGPPELPTLNEHLVGGGVSSGVFLDEESPEVFPAPVHKLVARYCRNAEDAVDLLTRYNYFWGPCNYLIADRQHRVAMIEKSACRIGVRWGQDGFGFVTAMTAERPEMSAFLADRRAASLVARGLPNPCTDTRYWAAQDNRRAIINRLLDEARRNPTLEKLRSIMQYRGPDGMVCDNGDVLFPGDPPIEHTIRTQICCLGEARALWWTRDNAKGTPSWRHPMPEVKFQDAPRWE